MSISLPHFKMKAGSSKMAGNEAVAAATIRITFLGFFLCCMSCISAQTTNMVLTKFFDFNTTHIGLVGKVHIPNGQPAVGASVELIEGSKALTSTTVQSNGSFALPYPNVLAGAYFIYIRKPGFATATFDLPMGNTLSDVVLRRAESIRGQISALNSRPLQGIRVVVSTVRGRHGPRGKYQRVDYKWKPPYWIHEKHRTDAAGRFEFNDLSKGFYAFQAYAPGLVSYTQEIETPTTSDINITMTSATGTISGRTIRFGSNEPLPGTTVSISFTRPPAHGPMISKGLRVISDYDGTFIFTGVEPGYYAVRSREDGLIEIIDSCGADLRQKQSAEVDVKLYAGHSVSGIVQDAITSEPLAGVLVSALSFGNEDSTTTTDSKGHYTIDHTFVGGGNRLFIQFQKDGYAYTSTSGSGREIPDVVLDMDKLAVRLDVPMFPKQPGEYDGSFD